MARSSAVAYFYIDRKGRRWLLMLSLIAMFPFLLATAFSFNASGALGQGLVATFLVFYTIVCQASCRSIDYSNSFELGIEITLNYYTDY